MNESYAQNGYLETAQSNMGFSTVRPGQLSPGRDGYGTYLGNDISSQTALARQQQDVENSRVALENHIGTLSKLQAFQDAQQMRPMKMREAELDLESKEITVSRERDRFRAEQPLLADAMDEANEQVKINRQIRKQNQTNAEKPIYMLLQDLYDSDDGKVSEDTLAMYNESRPDLPPLVSFEKDPATGQLYGKDDQGNVRPFTSMGVLTTWMKYHPDAQKWALSAMPENVRQQQIAEIQLQREQDKADAANAKTDFDMKQKAISTRMSAVNNVLDGIKDTINDLQSRLKDGTYNDESERLEIEKQLEEQRTMRRAYQQQLNALLSGGNAPTGGNGGGGDATTVQSAANDAQTMGVGAGTGGGGAGNIPSFRNVNKAQ